MASWRDSCVFPAGLSAAAADDRRDVGAVAIVVVGGEAVAHSIVESGNAVFEIYMGENPRVKHCNAYTFAGDAARGRAAAVDQFSDIVHLKCLSCGVFLLIFYAFYLIGIKIRSKKSPRYACFKRLLVILMLNSLF